MKKNNVLRNEACLVLIIFCSSLFEMYFGLLRYRYLVAPGDDVYFHLQYAWSISQHGLPLFSTSYPYLFHLIIIGVAKLANVSLSQSLTFVAPSLLVLSGLAVWYLARNIFNPLIALVAYFLYALVSLQPLQTYFDGSLPNILAAGIIVPTLFATINQLFVHGLKKSTVVKIILLSTLLILAHHLTVLVTFSVLLCWGIPLLLFFSFKKGIAWFLAGSIIAVILTASLVWLFLNGSIFEPARNILLNYVQILAHFPYIAFKQIASVQPWNTATFGHDVGGLIFQAGLLGAICLPIFYRKKPERYGILLLSVWFALYLIGSLHVWSGEPTRLGRDLAIPACVLGAAILVHFFNFLQLYSKNISKIFIGLVIILMVSAGIRRFKILASYSEAPRFSGADSQAYNYLIDNGLSHQVTVLTLDQSWQTLLQIWGTAKKFNSVESAGLFPPAVKSPCYLITKYQSEIWLPQSDRGNLILKSYSSQNGLEVKRVFSDPNKDLYLLCSINN